MLSTLEEKYKEQNTASSLELSTAKIKVETKNTPTKQVPYIRLITNYQVSCYLNHTTNTGVIKQHWRRETKHRKQVEGLKYF